MGAEGGLRAGVGGRYDSNDEESPVRGPGFLSDPKYAELEPTLRFH
jgi:hypothetical protein